MISNLHPLNILGSKDIIKIKATVSLASPGGAKISLAWIMKGVLFTTYNVSKSSNTVVLMRDISSSDSYIQCMPDN